MTFGTIFWPALSAYLVGWLFCNIFLFQVADRLRDHDKRQRRFGKMETQEYWNLAHPTAAVDWDKRLGKTREYLMQQIVDLMQAGMTDQQILGRYPGLGAADLEAARAYSNV